jgi:hypothetical protein
MDTSGMINLVVVGLMVISFMLGLIMGNQMNNRDNDNNYRY